MGVHRISYKLTVNHVYGKTPRKVKITKKTVKGIE